MGGSAACGAAKGAGELAAWPDLAANISARSTADVLRHRSGGLHWRRRRPESSRRRTAEPARDDCRVGCVSGLRPGGCSCWGCFWDNLRHRSGAYGLARCCGGGNCAPSMQDAGHMPAGGRFRSGFMTWRIGASASPADARRPVRRAPHSRHGTAASARKRGRTYVGAADPASAQTTTQEMGDEGYESSTPAG